MYAEATSQQEAQHDYSGILSSQISNLGLHWIATITQRNGILVRKDAEIENYNKAEYNRSV